LRNSGKSSLECEWAVWLGKGWGNLDRCSGSCDCLAVLGTLEDVWRGISFVAIAMFDLENFIQLFSIGGMQSSTSHIEKGASYVSIRNTHHK